MRPKNFKILIFENFKRRELCEIVREIKQNAKENKGAKIGRAHV